MDMRGMLEEVIIFNNFGNELRIHERYLYLEEEEFTKSFFV